MRPEDFARALARLGYALTERQQAQFAAYFELLVDWNARMNLTAVTDLEGVYLKHFYDSVAPILLGLLGGRGAVASATGADGVVAVDETVVTAGGRPVAADGNGVASATGADGADVDFVEADGIFAAPATDDSRPVEADGNGVTTDRHSVAADGGIVRADVASVEAGVESVAPDSISVEADGNVVAAATDNGKSVAPARGTGGSVASDAGPVASNATAVTADSPSVASATADGDGLRLLDIGAGAGFPSLPMKILLPGLRVTIVDALAKRLRFLSALTDALGLADVTLLHGRAEDFGQAAAYREGFDLVTARAVARLNVLSELTLPFLRRGGDLLAYKASDADQELLEAKRALATLGGKCVCQRDYELTTGGETLSRRILVIKKTGRTPKKYPRKAGTPNKQPL